MGGQVGCEPRIEEIVKLQKKVGVWLGGGGWLVAGLGQRVGVWRCEPRIEGIVKCTLRYIKNNKNPGEGARER